MSFSRDIKSEIIKTQCTKDCCGASFLYAYLRIAGEFQLENGKMHFIVKNTDEEMFKFLSNITILTYQEKIKQVEENIVFGEKLTQSMIEKFGILEGEDFTNFREQKFLCQNCFKWFLIGAYLASGTSNIVLNHLDKNGVNKKSSGYSLEFSFFNIGLARDFSFFLAELDCITNIVAVKDKYKVYLKDFDKICDLLVLMNANSCVLTLYEENAYRSLKNKINRENNCISANINRAVDAGTKQFMAIKKIKEKMGLDKLNDKLKEVAELRLIYPEESLDALLSHFEEKISKSGLNYRLNQLLKIAEDL